MIRIGRFIRNKWRNFWYDSNWNGIYGYGSHTSMTIKEGRLGLVISIICVISFIVYLIIK